MIFRRSLATVWLVLAMVAPGFAAEDAYVEVASVINGKSFVLQDGSVVRLASIQAPNVEEKTGKMRAGEPMGEEAKAALAALILHQKVRVDSGKVIVDRHGRLVGQVYLQDGRWVQGELLKAGMAMVYSFVDQRKFAGKMLEFEARARAAKRGIWANDYFQVITPEQAGEYVGRFKLVEGKVVSAAVVGGNGYLNFGEDWKTDFTVFIPKHHMKLFKKLDISTLTGQVIRVRGWIYSKFGPSIDIDHPEQVEEVYAR